MYKFLNDVYIICYRANNKIYKTRNQNMKHYQNIKIKKSFLINSKHITFSCRVRPQFSGEFIIDGVCVFLTKNNGFVIVLKN